MNGFKLFFYLFLKSQRVIEKKTDNAAPLSYGPLLPRNNSNSSGGGGMEADSESRVTRGTLLERDYLGESY